MASQQAKDKKKALDWSLLWRVLGLARPYRNRFVMATVQAVVLTVLAIAIPYLVQMTIDREIMQLDWTGLRNMAAILIAVLIAESLLRYSFIYLTSWLGQSIIKDLRTRVFNHVLRLRLKYFDRTPIGTATTRTINDVETINDVFSNGVISIVADLLLILGIIAAMLLLSFQKTGAPWLALVSMSTMPLLFFATYLFKEAVKSAFQRVRTQVSRLNAFLQEHITGMKIVQIFNAEKRESKRFEDINAEHRDAHISAIWAYSIFFPVVELLLAATIGLMVWYAAGRMVATNMEPGVIISFILYINMLFRPLRMIADRFNTLQMGLVASDRVFGLLDRDEYIADNGKHEAEQLQGEIEFDKVWFAYNDEDYVLKDISFKIESGETLAIVGATGSGKTSTINILSRFYETQQGNIKIDGVDIKDYSLANLRSHLSVVLQDVFLFSGSVLENITLRSEKVSREQAIEAAKIVGAHGFISKLPGGYDYQVMERGATLSVGQRQLISFVRALVFNPSILILDEATSSIDTESEEIIQNAIEKLISKRTSIVIAHRLSTIQNADKIMVLDKGRLMELGTHEELLARNGHYRQLHDMQFNKEVAA